MKSLTSSSLPAASRTLVEGVLLVNSPAGKTLLAEPLPVRPKFLFLSVSGSDFMQMFVGVGAF